MFSKQMQSDAKSVDAFFKAAQLGNLTAVTYMHKVNPSILHAKNSEGKNVFEHLCRCNLNTSQHHAVIQYLLEAGLQPLSHDEAKKNAIYRYAFIDWLSPDQAIGLLLITQQNDIPAEYREQWMKYNQSRKWDIGDEVIGVFKVDAVKYLQDQIEKYKPKLPSTTAAVSLSKTPGK